MNYESEAWTSNCRCTQGIFMGDTFLFLRSAYNNIWSGTNVGCDREIWNFLIRRGVFTIHRRGTVWPGREFALKLTTRNNPIWNSSNSPFPVLSLCWNTWVNQNYSFNYCMWFFENWVTSWVCFFFFLRQAKAMTIETTPKSYPGLV